MREVDIRRLTTAFNIADPDQKRLYDHANKRKNVSAYLKRLIQRDMEGGGALRLAAALPTQAEEPPARLDGRLMKGLI